MPRYAATCNQIRALSADSIPQNSQCKRARKKIGRLVIEERNTFERDPSD